MTDDPRRAPGADLPAWIESLTAALGVDRALVDIDRLLEVAADVAHQVARPAVPVTMFIAGLAAAGSRPGADPARGSRPRPAPGPPSSDHRPLLRRRRGGRRGGHRAAARGVGRAGPGRDGRPRTARAGPRARPVRAARGRHAGRGRRPGPPARRSTCCPRSRAADRGAPCERGRVRSREDFVAPDGRTFTRARRHRRDARRARQPPIALIGRSGCRNDGSSMSCPAFLPARQRRYASASAVSTSAGDGRGPGRGVVPIRTA